MGDYYENNKVEECVVEGNEPQLEHRAVSDDGNSDFKQNVEDKQLAHTVTQASLDEPQPGSIMLIVASHYNEMKKAGRQERLKSRILHMRNFNNWIKSQLISEYLQKIKSTQNISDPLRVLDIGCGTGGDLLKWEKEKIKHLIGTDIAEVSLEQCKARYNEMQTHSSFGSIFSAEFFVCDSTLVRLRERYKDPSLKLNLVSCQFAFHYSFESLSQADCMVRNAAECLHPGGYFIATIPDAYEIMRRLQQSPNPRSFGNDVYNIEFHCDTLPPPLFGAKYQFYLEGVVDCPEFLVYFPTLIKLCRKHGLKLERKTTFGDYYKETVDNGRSLLHRMNCLEPVYPNRNRNNDQYEHLRSLAKSSYNSKPYGTLSKSEWEASTIEMTDLMIPYTTVNPEKILTHSGRACQRLIHNGRQENCKQLCGGHGIHHRKYISNECDQKCLECRQLVTVKIVNRL